MMGLFELYTASFSIGSSTFQVLPPSGPAQEQEYYVFTYIRSLVVVGLVVALQPRLDRDVVRAIAVSVGRGGVRLGC